jgi:hypothetical protein
MKKAPAGKPGLASCVPEGGLKRRGDYCAADEVAGAADDGATEAGAELAAAGAEDASGAEAEGATEVVPLSAGAVVAGAIGVVVVVVVVLSAGAAGVVVVVVAAGVLFTVVVEGCELAEKTRYAMASSARATMMPTNQPVELLSRV